LIWLLNGVYTLHNKRVSLSQDFTVWRRVVFSSSFDQPTAPEPASTVGQIRATAQAPRSLGSKLRPGLLRHAAESVFAAIFPAECRICGKLLTNISRLPVCLDCLHASRTFDGPQCGVCGELLLGQLVVGQEPLCGLCQRARPAYERAFAFGPYEGTLRDLIHLLKYQRVAPAARPLGEFAAPALCAALRGAGQDAVLVPIPLYSAKSRQRTFNQAEEIAREAVQACGGKIKVDAKLLARVRETKSQTGLTRHQRRENVRGAFAVPAKLKGAVKGRNIILLDDVFTTGTTAEECARVLKRAGAAQVWVVTVARVSKLETASLPREQSLLQRPTKERATAALGNAAGNLV
jgi:ComF family protein